MSKRRFQGKVSGRGSKRAKKQACKPFEGTHDEVLLEDVRKLLSSTGRQSASKPAGDDIATKLAETRTLEKFSENEVEIKELSSTGDGLGFSSSTDHVLVVPFTVPGDTVKAKTVRNQEINGYVSTDLVEVIKPSSRRNDALIKCPYFIKCSGCQFQMMQYEDQLAHKKTIVEKAYVNFSGLDLHFVPPVSETIGSPLQYGYRTKLTPHFDGPPGMKRHYKPGVEKPMFKEVPPIGFMQKGTRWTIDIEDCPIGTEAVREGMKSERARVAKDIGKYSKGATLLLRESTERVSKEGIDRGTEAKELETSEVEHDKIDTENSNDYTETKTCITDSNATSTEYIDSYIFANPAGSFFQNNNSILPKFTQYIRDKIQEAFLSSSASSQQQESSTAPRFPPLTHLIDAYCGSGLFTITLSSLFQSSIGIDIDPKSITSAEKNAALNKTKNTRFVAATASEIFRSVKDLPPEQTVVVIDPPRKGCDEGFLKQLLAFGPRLVVYVSCNVHTQARDVGVLVKGTDSEEGEGNARYRLKSLQGFDFFPQTSHVEGVAVLERVRGEEVK